MAKRPLLRAVMEDNHSMVSRLLERGANTNTRDLLQTTYIFYALWFDGHNSLRTLLDNPNYHCNTNCDAGWTIIHSAAIFADIGSLHIVMSKGLYELNTAEEDVFAWTAMQHAQYRWLNNEEWSRNFRQPRDNDPTERYNAFEELQESITEAQASMAGYINDEASEEETSDSEVSCSLSDETYEDDEDEDEFWEDAQEDLDVQS